jgi:hypothetical protein
MYAARLDTVEKRQEYRKFSLNGYETREYPELDCIIGITTNGLIAAKAYTGTSAKPEWHYRFQTMERMEKYIAEYLESRKKTLEYKQERKNKRKAPALAAVPFKVGDIFSDSWGYDQTNIDFYEVVAVKSASTIVIRQIAQDTEETGFMCGNTTPRPGEYTGERMEKRVQWYDGKAHIKSEFGWCSKWDGKPERCSWYA